MKLIAHYSRGRVHQNPTSVLLCGCEISNWNTDSYTSAEESTLITYETISCSRELNYLKIHPGVISIQSSRTLQKKKKKKEEKEKE